MDKQLTTHRHQREVLRGSLIPTPPKSRKNRHGRKQAKGQKERHEDDRIPKYKIDVIADGEIQYLLTIDANGIGVIAYGLLQQLQIVPKCGNEILISQSPDNSLKCR